ncbi:hypothetical protein MIND_00361700 [Mycena indigotica]|uniref:Uncharacterized protein n=1 Tax=Mycena indigotica TaxID=2126181 RepID=A0A8H6WEW6_9AGAR|nr:uncharacterized protein MIND_00361700 [Mycena indigotica]KAF7309894.1 hypothetical protein MIND_00361700 [Mycena indigotica]
MPKPVVFAPKPAIAKLPLAVRKDIRDNFDANMDDFKARIKAKLGVDYTININAAEVWAYASEGDTSAGTCFKGRVFTRFQLSLDLIASRYIEGFISGIESFISKYEDNGKTYFNEAVTQAEITLTVNILGDKAETLSADVKDGVYRILFRHDRLGYNQSWQESTILPAIEGVDREGFSLSAKHSIEDDFEGSIDEVRDEINKMLGAEFTLDPNFEEVYAALKASSQQDWQANIGRTILNYFNGLKYQLESQGFKDDDMLQEGLQEMVETKTFRVRVLPKTNSTTETVIEDGVVYLQTRPDRWGYNANDMGEGLIKLL